MEVDAEQQQQQQQNDQISDSDVPQQQSNALLHTFILCSTVASCVLFAIGILYAHFIGRRRNRLPDLPHSSTTARFWNALAGSAPGARQQHHQRQDAGPKAGVLSCRPGDEAEALLGRHGAERRGGNDDDSDSGDSL